MAFLAQNWDTIMLFMNTLGILIVGLSGGKK